MKDCLVVSYERFLAGACQCDRTYDADENLFFEKQIKFERCRRVNSIRVGDDSKNCRVNLPVQIVFKSRSLVNPSIVVGHFGVYAERSHRRNNAAKSSDSGAVKLMGRPLCTCFTRNFSA